MDTASIVTEIRALLVEHYVFPDIATELDALLEKRHTEGAYDAAATAEELGSLVTADLQTVNGDRHLRLKHHADEIPDGDDAAATQEMTKAAKLSFNGVPRLRALDGGVAHLELAPLLFPVEMSGEALTAALTVLAGADALILDLRENRGGDPATVALVCSYLLAEPTHLNTMYLRDGESYRQSWSLPYVPGRRFGGTKPVYVLTSPRTFSGAEELAYNLQQLGRATVVGERTGGGAHPRRGFRVHPHLEATIPTGRAINPVSGTNWELVGVSPDIEVPADEALDRAHREALEKLAG